MSSQKWCAEFEVESHLCLKNPLEHLTFRDPRNRYSIDLRNLNCQPGIEKPTLAISVIFDSDLKPERNKEQGKKLSELAEIYLNEFLATFGLVTKTKSEIIECRKIIHWNKGLTDRFIYQFKSFPDPNLPVFGLTEDHVRSAEFFAEREVHEKLEKAVNWYWRGVNSKYFEDQFRAFWFSLENLASHTKSIDPVPDKCPKCQSPLFCQTCNETPMHKPFNKQAIEQLLLANVSNSIDSEKQRITETLFEIRNRLSHGDFTSEIERSLNIIMKDWNDLLGNIVWAGLISTFKFSENMPNVGLELVHPTTYAHYSLNLIVFGSTGNPASNRDEPKPGDFAGLEVKMDVLPSKQNQNDNKFYSPEKI